MDKFYFSNSEFYLGLFGFDKQVLSCFDDKNNFTGFYYISLADLNDPIQSLEGGFKKVEFLMEDDTFKISLTSRISAYTILTDKTTRLLSFEDFLSSKLKNLFEELNELSITYSSEPVKIKIATSIYDHLRIPKIFVNDSLSLSQFKSHNCFYWSIENIIYVATVFIASMILAIIIDVFYMRISNEEDEEEYFENVDEEIIKCSII